MFRDLRERVTPTRRLLAWVLLALLVAFGALMLPRLYQHPSVVRGADLLFWAAVAYAGVRLITFWLLDPLLRQRQNATPGFARDLIVVLLWMFAIGGILREVVGISLGQLLGTGALAAAIVGLSLQQTLGNLFAGISLHLDPAFQEGDWIEITGNLRPGGGRDTYIAEVMAMTWRTVQLRTENGDMDIFPNQVIAQAVVTNLYVPSGLHRRTLKVVVEPHPRLHQALAKLNIALAGTPHFMANRPEVVVHSLDLGGAVLEARFWTLGFRHGRAATYQVSRLLATVLPREGFCLLGPHGATTAHPPVETLDPHLMGELVRLLKLPAHWSEDLLPHIRIRTLAPGEGVIREGDPGESLFAVVSGMLHVVKAEEREEPYHGLYWRVMAELHAGNWFGEHSLLTGAPRSATIVAVTEARVVEIPKAGFEESLRREPEVLERLMDLMERRSEQRAGEAATPERRRENWKAQIKAWFGLG
ncbi:MAG TPA: mechanosensitive ion channel family protein [Holophagaceae bacterium]|nr:mechanosensitive ion channel family protein [Holophagaceae bacterium]